jgi:acetyl-CoA carboxylase biotin carboxyl carrier protein
MMNLKELKEIIQIIEESNIDEMEIEREGLRIKVRKNSKEPIQPQHSISHVVAVPTPIQTTISAPVNNASEVQSAQVAASPEIKMAESKLMSIVSPMVGTFYRAPSPKSDPYVETGSAVKKGQAVCIVEAMKLMNEIESEIDGKIVRVLVENGQPVEYGQALFEVEPV